MLLAVIIIFLLAAIIHHYYVNWCFYKVWWKTPGPWSLPFAGSLNYCLSVFRDPLDGVLKSMVSYYGSDRLSVWFGPRYLLLTHRPKDVEIVLTHPDCIDKFDMFYDILEPVTGNGLIRLKTEHWKKNRKHFSTSFHKQVLESFIDDLYKNSCRLVEQMRDDYGCGERDISYFMYNFVVWSYCANFMGVDVEELNRKHHWGTILTRAKELTVERVRVLHYAIDFIYHLLPRSKEYYRAVNGLRQFSMSVLEQSTKKFGSSNTQNVGMKRKILVELMLELESEQKPSTIDLYGEATGILVGGTDTTALTLSITAVILGMYPEIQETVHQEVLDVCGRSDPIAWNHLSELKYLERVFYEVLRLFPAVPQVFRQTRTYVDLGNIVLPPGAGVGVMVYSTHRDPHLWKDPLKFDPDRFLPEACAERQPCTFLPFSAGPRNCIGLKYAMIEMKIGLANLIRNFKFQSKYKSTEEIKVDNAVFINMLDRYPCKVEIRP